MTVHVECPRCGCIFIKASESIVISVRLLCEVEEFFSAKVVNNNLQEIMS